MIKNHDCLFCHSMCHNFSGHSLWARYFQIFTWGCVSVCLSLKTMKALRDYVSFFGPTLWSFKIASVLSPLLCPKSYHTSRHYFFLIFCNKLACYKCRKVTKPDFRRKIRNFFYKQFFEKSGFWPFSREHCISFG